MASPPPLVPPYPARMAPPPLVPPSPARMMPPDHAFTIRIEFPHVTAKSILFSIVGIVLVTLVVWCCKKILIKSSNSNAAGDRPAQPPIDPELFEDALCGPAGALSCSGCG